MSTQITYLLELEKIFEDSGWKSKENSEQVFNSLCSLSEVITENVEDYELILELLSRFHWISLNDYYNSCREILTKIIDNLDTRIFNLYTFPIIKRRHQNNVKSGSFISYLIKAILPTIPKAKRLHFEDINNFDDLKKKKFTKSDVILLVDDFIGTGNTFNDCISEIETINKDLLDKVIIFTIAIKKDTLEIINRHYKIFHKIEVLKGITDYNSLDKIEYKKNIMRNIEKKIFSNIRDYTLGYKESESLIALLRTPDNTFPFFWREYKKRINIIPPFPRNEKV